MKRSFRKKNMVKIFAVAAIVTALVTMISSHYLKGSKEQIVAKVNGQKIFKSEIERKLHNVFDGRSQGMQIPEIESLPQEVIDILVKEIYFEKELTKKAEKSKSSKTKEVKDKITDAKNKILRQAYIDSVLKEEITDQKINDKYLDLSNKIAGKKEYSISHIVVKTKEEAQKIYEELKSKKSSPNKFSELAKKYSMDQESASKAGDLGYILEDNMIKEIGDIAVAMKKDDISTPIETKFGWHIIKIKDVRDAELLQFESVKDGVREQLIQEKLSDINSDIIKDAKVEMLIQLKKSQPESFNDQKSLKNEDSKVMDQKVEGSEDSNESLGKLEQISEKTTEKKDQKESDAKAKDQKNK